MTHHIRTFSTVLMMLAFSLPAFAADRYKYSELQIKDYDEIGALVKDKVKKAMKVFREKGDAEENAAPDQAGVEELRSALHLILARPNQDNMLAKLMPEVRKELSNVNAFEDSLSSLASEAIEGLRNEKLPTVFRSTYLFVLENIISEFKPEIRDKAELRKIFEKIRDAKLAIPKDVTKDLKLRSMLKVESPSERAKQILEKL
jgi:hypothetical protein